MEKEVGFKEVIPRLDFPAINSQSEFTFRTLATSLARLKIKCNPREFVGNLFQTCHKFPLLSFVEN